MEHVLPVVAGLVYKSDEERIKYIREKHWIGYPLAQKTLKKLEDLFNHPQTHRMPNILIKSHTNNGKSYLLKRFLRMHPPYEDQNDQRVKTPIIYLEVPPAPTPESLYVLILQALHIAYRDSNSKDTKRKKAIDGIGYYGVKMIMIDELHVLMNTTKLLKAQLLDTIKYLGNDGEVPIVGSGTLEAHRAIVSDEQLGNRFEPLLLPQWKLNTEFRRLLASFEKALPLKYPSNLSEQEITTHIYSMSGGWIGEVDEVLRRASIKAIQKGEEKITVDILKSLDWIAPETRLSTE